MGNECMEPHPHLEALHCERPAHHAGEHCAFTGWGSEVKRHYWPKTTDTPTAG